MESASYGIYALVVFISEISLVRFLIRQQLMRKYRTPALSMRCFLFTFYCPLSSFFLTQRHKLQYTRGCYHKLIQDKLDS